MLPATETPVVYKRFNLRNNKFEFIQTYRFKMQNKIMQIFIWT
jgi:hypothetical protein